MTFNPDEYLAKKAPAPMGGFNPDAYLAKKTEVVEPAPAQPEEQPGLISRGLSFLNRQTEKLDAPMRAATIEGVKKYGGGLSIADDFRGMPSKPYEGPGVIGAFKEQYGKPTLPQYEPEKLPEALGVAPGANSTAASFLTEMAAPSSLLAGPLVKGAVKGGKAISKLASPIGSAISEGTARVTSKVGSAATGVNENVLKRYIDKTDEINKAIKDVGGDWASKSEKEIAKNMSDIQTTRSKLSGEISKTLSKAPKDRVIDVTELAERSKSSGAWDDISHLFSETPGIEQVGSRYKVNLDELNKIKNTLQDIASPSYTKDGQIFAKGPEIARQAKGLAAEARKALNTNAPEIATANNKLSMLHNLEKRSQKNLIKAGSADTGLMSAGLTTGSRAEKNLSMLQDITGTPMVERARNYATAKEMDAAGLMSRERSGGAVERYGKQIAVIGGVGAVGGPAAAVLAAATSSPIAWKKAIQAGNVSKKALSALSSASGLAGDKLYEFASTKKGKAILAAAMSGQKTMLGDKDAGN